jgi:sulfur relay (sulfurtransferase) DsrF/TusC family protein
LASKRIVVVVRHSPFNTARDEEALRVAVGLTIANPDPAVLLLDDAVWLALPLAPEAIDRPQVRKHWETLADLGLRRLAERESLRERGITPERLAAGVETVSRSEVADLLAVADAVLVY